MQSVVGAAVNPKHHYELQQLRGHPDDSKELMWIATGECCRTKEEAIAIYNMAKRTSPSRIYRMIKISVVSGG